jgi:hypothetical protein
MAGIVRRTSLALGLVLVIAAAGAAAWLWPRARSTNSTSAAPSGTTASTAQPSANASTAPAPLIVLQLNGATAERVTSGSPVFFTLSLTGSPGQPAIRLGASGSPWTASVRFETATGAPLPFRVESVGRAVSYPAGSRERGDDRAIAGEDIAVVDGARIHRAQFGVSPDEASRIPRGKHEIRAVLAPQGQTAPSSTSNVVALTVEQPSGDAAQLAVAEKSRLVASARFHLRASRWDDAHRVALEIAKRSDADTVAYMLLADALNGLRRDEEALAAYEEALGALPANTTESPDYILARMEEVRGRLEATAAKREAK